MLDDFTTGNRDTVDRLNELVEVARQVKNMTGDDTIKVRHTASGINISMDRQKRGSSSGGSVIRKAYAKAAAGASGSITCYLDTDGTGEEVSVSCEVAGGTNLNAAVPRLADGDMIHVYNDAGTWRSIMTFQASEDCS